MPPRAVSALLEEKSSLLGDGVSLGRGKAGNGLGRQNLYHASLTFAGEMIFLCKVEAVLPQVATMSGHEKSALFFAKRKLCHEKSARIRAHHDLSRTGGTVLWQKGTINRDYAFDKQ